MDKLKKVSKYSIEIFEWVRPDDIVVLISGEDTRISYAGAYGTEFKNQFEKLLNALDLRRA